MSTVSIDDPAAFVPQQNLSMEAKFDSFMANQTLFNNKLSDMINEQNNQFMANQTLFNNKLSDIMNEQKNKLAEIENIAKSVAEQQVEIKKLEQQNPILPKNVADLA